MMKPILWTLFVLWFISCGSDSRESSAASAGHPGLQSGVWVSELNSACAVTLEFNGDQYTQMHMCLTGNTVRVEYVSGTYALAGNEASITPTRHSCVPGAEPHTVQYSLSGNSLSYGSGSTALVFIRQPETKPTQSYTFIFGCYTDDGFEPNPTFI